MPSEKKAAGEPVGISDNARCCIGVVVFHEVTVGNPNWKAKYCLMPKSEHPLKGIWKVTGI